MGIGTELVSWVAGRGGGVLREVFIIMDYKTWFFLFWCTVVRTEGTCSFRCRRQNRRSPRIIMWGMGSNDDYAGGFVILLLYY